jgi:class 3 adenylate cyclase
MRRNREIKPGPDIPKHGRVEGYAIIVDLNQFSSMVTKAEETGDAVAQFIRDALAGAIFEIEAEGGEVVAFMGDAVLGFMPPGEGVALACFGIAKDLDEQCEYVSNEQEGDNHAWPFAPGGPSLKISIEYGMMDVSTINSRLLGEHRLLIGSPINYADRISKAGIGNRCIIGPMAAERAFKQYTLDGPHQIAGKPGEREHECYVLDLGDIWIDGAREPGKETYSGVCR